MNIKAKSAAYSSTRASNKAVRPKGSKKDGPMSEWGSRFKKRSGMRGKK